MNYLGKDNEHLEKNAVAFLDQLYIDGYIDSIYDARA